MPGYPLKDSGANEDRRCSLRHVPRLSDEAWGLIFGTCGRPGDVACLRTSVPGEQECASRCVSIHNLSSLPLSRSVTFAARYNPYFDLFRNISLPSRRSTELGNGFCFNLSKALFASHCNCNEVHCWCMLVMIVIIQPKARQDRSLRKGRELPVQKSSGQPLISIITHKAVMQCCGVWEKLQSLIIFLPFTAFFCHFHPFKSSLIALFLLSFFFSTAISFLFIFFISLPLSLCSFSTLFCALILGPLSGGVKGYR